MRITIHISALTAKNPPFSSVHSTAFRPTDFDFIAHTKIMKGPSEIRAKEKEKERCLRKENTANFSFLLKKLFHAFMFHRFHLILIVLVHIRLL